MQRIEKLPKVEIHELGEFRMGVMGYGLTIHTAYGTYDFLKAVPTLIGGTNHNSIIEISKDERYIKVAGPDVTYILDSKFMKISIYRISVRIVIPENKDRSGNTIVSDENCVFGPGQTHISSFQQPIYLQCPWVRQEEIIFLTQKYRALRKSQLTAAVDAI